MARRSAQTCRARLVRVENLLERAMASADRRGYTGMLHHKGLFDDPRVKALMRKRDALIRKC